MPVFLVSVNSLTEDGLQRPMPEVIGLVTSQLTPEAAVAWTCANEAILMRDVRVECLVEHGLYWYQDGPETYQ